MGLSAGAKTLCIDILRGFIDTKMVQVYLFIFVNTVFYLSFFFFFFNTLSQFLFCC